MTFKKKVIWAGMIAAALLAGCSAQTSAEMDYIGLDAAKAQALSASGLSSSEVEFTTEELTSRNGLDYYALVLTYQGEDYEYDIDALTGIVIESRLPDSSVTTPPEDSLVTDADTYDSTQTETAVNETETDAGTAASSSSPNTSASTSTNTSASTGTGASTNTSAGTGTSANTGTSTSAGTLIGEEAAKAAALDHAGLTASQVTFVKQKLKWDDGRQIYDVEFYTSDYTEYDYEIDAYTGAVLSYDYDADSYTAPADNSSTITAEEAQAIALAQVPGASASDIRKFKLDRDDGRLQYEGKIVYNGMEYEFEIDAYSGAIRSWEADSIHD